MFSEVRWSDPLEDVLSKLRLEALGGEFLEFVSGGSRPGLLGQKNLRLWPRVATSAPISPAPLPWPWGESANARDWHSKADS